TASAISTADAASTSSGATCETGRGGAGGSGRAAVGRREARSVRSWPPCFGFSKALAPFGGPDFGLPRGAGRLDRELIGLFLETAQASGTGISERSSLPTHSRTETVKH